MLGACGGGAKPTTAATPAAATPPAAAPTSRPVPAPASGSTAGMRSTKSGVYTEDQATEGGQVFDSRCSSCHTVESLFTPEFKGKYGGKPLLNLWKFITNEMPEDSPGSLSNAEYVLVHAYILSKAGAPAGTTPLVPDTVALNAIVFDTTGIPARRFFHR
jgi:mono/diheme cytochrome c family protein